jgi:hydroxyacylglutathione hydrolase
MKFLFLLTAVACFAVEPGQLPSSWRTGGPNCLEIPEWQVHEYNPTFYILRQSGCVHYEKPFLYLIIGKQRALLVDTGAGQSTAADAVKKLMDLKKLDLPLVVTHSHGHGDHTAGDKAFQAMPNVTLVPAAVEAEQKFYGIEKWPDQPGAIDLGDRPIDVIAIPGHQVAHLAYYDRQTGILLTGDHLYPGRLYVYDAVEYLRSTRRMVDFTASKPVAHILGCHIEQSVEPFVDYPTGTKYQPREHSLELGRAHLLELLSGLEVQKGELQKALLRDFTIDPRKPR